MKRFLLAQVTDMHIKAGGKLSYRVVDTAGSLARCIVVIAGDEDDGKQDAGCRELAPQIDAGFIMQVDVENDAAGVVEMIVSPQGFRGIEQDRVEAVFPEQPLYPP